MTQEQRILDHLRSGRTITPLEALRQFGCFRLGARIWDLKRKGHPIEVRLVDAGDGKHVAEYYIAGPVTLGITLDTQEVRYG